MKQWLFCLLLSHLAFKERRLFQTCGCIGSSHGHDLNLFSLQKPAVSSDNTPANKILFVENLPEQSTTQMLTMLFQQFPGFREVRLVDARPGIAFVEYESDAQVTLIPILKIAISIFFC